MRRKDERGGRRALIGVAVAAMLVVVLLAAGAILRMHAWDMGFAQAFKSFVSDTFRPGSGA